MSRTPASIGWSSNHKTKARLTRASCPVTLRVNETGALVESLLITAGLGPGTWLKSPVESTTLAAGRIYSDSRLYHPVSSHTIHLCCRE